MTDLEWSTNTDWNNAQSSENIDINSGTFELADAIPDSVVYDFEDGDVSGWTINNIDASFTASSSVSYQGSFSGFSDGGIFDDNSPRAIEYVDAFPDKKMNTLTFYWNETDDQSGFEFSLFDSSGNELLTIGSDNPEWIVDDANGTTTWFSGDGYNRWVEFVIDFDWTNNTFTASGGDLQSGSTATYNGTLQSNVGDVSDMAIGSNDWGGNCNEFYIDEITADIVTG